MWMNRPSHLNTLQRRRASQFGPADASRGRVCGFGSGRRRVLQLSKVGQHGVRFAVRTRAPAVTLRSLHELWLHLLWNDWRDKDMKADSEPEPRRVPQETNYLKPDQQDSHDTTFIIFNTF